ncbi:MAG: AtpZ/AtpI family protein [Bacillota bacterium]|jgi:hypothetical protein|nr:AtpZ/AtpI family protein [Bacillota bacterium]
MTRVLLAVEIASFILMGFVIGSYVDSKQGTRPWGTIIGFLVGLFLGVMSVRRAIDEISSRAVAGEGPKVVKVVRRPISVRADEASGDPKAFYYRGTEHKVEAVMSKWRDFTSSDKAMLGGKRKERDWWLNGCGKVNYRIRTEDGRVFDLQYDERKSEWILDKFLE